MNTKKIMKRAIFWALGFRLIGRAARKCSWIGLKLSSRFHRIFSQVYNRIPLVRSGPRGELDDAKSRYYSHLSYVCSLMPVQPLISIIVPIYNVPEEFLTECLESVAVQTYEKWELCLVDDCSNGEHIKKVVQEFSLRFPDQVHFSINGENSHISVTSNNALAMAKGEYVALLDHDDLLTPNALGEMVRYINLNNAPDILYSDERTVDAHGLALNEPFLKPDWSPLLHASVNYTTHLTLYKRQLVMDVGAFRVGFEGSQDHDLMLRCSEVTKKPIVHVPFVLYKWRAHPQSTAYSLSAKPYAAQAGERAVEEHFKRRGRPASVSWEAETGHYRIKFTLPENKPLVSVLIPTKDASQLLEKCLESIEEKSSWTNLELIILDNNSREKETFDLFESWKRKIGDRLKIIRCDFPFNFAKMNNLGAEAASGDYLILLNNDTEVVSPNWIEEMLMIAQWPEIGAVGAKLLYPSGNIQHAGILLADRSIAMHAALAQPEKTKMYIDMANTVHEVSAVTGACLMIAKEKFFRAGGLDELWVPNGFGDVDFAIKLRSLGLSNVFTPYALLIHHESPSRKANIENFEHFYLMQKYGSALLNDPYFHPAFHRHPHYQRNEHFGLID